MHAFGDTRSDRPRQRSSQQVTASNVGRVTSDRYGNGWSDRKTSLHIHTMLGFLKDLSPVKKAKVRKEDGFKGALF